ncbi:unnamed protein product [Ranitomeya imitator]|uniref:Kazal-like domain-containing protein n=1 Tax=Ranitomeya imitator TaxID=111125 RepID=A0ABN9LJ08_9NEOB|nr:unnamed protein product [Ranitomeya imitator]
MQISSSEIPCQWRLTSGPSKVCGTDNKTYTSACHLFGTKCLLEGTKEGNHLHLDYQGPCKYIPTCTEYELTHFPFRMRDWLKNVLMQLYERDKENTGLLSEKQKSKASQVKKIYDNEKRLRESDPNIELLVKDFQKNYNMYVYPVHWQFHQLDQHLVDRLLTHSELAALRASLIPIEHCVKAFLQECNANNDRHISLWEWCHCFGIKEVQNVITKWQLTGTVEVKIRSGRPSKISERPTHRIAREATLTKTCCSEPSLKTQKILHDGQ